MLNTLAKYFHTIRYLKPIQFYGLLRRRIKMKFKMKPIRVSSLACTPPKIRTPKAAWSNMILRNDRLHDGNLLECINQTFNIDKPTIWRDHTKSRLWLYHLHYFNYLFTAANDDPTITSKQSVDLMLRWISENPATIGTGWEPYPTSLRIVNWVKWLLLNNAQQHTTILNSLAQQVQYLRKNLEIHLLANHLLANAKALVFGSLFFANNAHVKHSIHLFTKQLLAQIHDDGGHVELSPMYHAIVLEDLLDVMQLCRIYKYAYPSEFDAISHKMGQWLGALCHADGEFALFNDTAHRYAASHAQLQNYAALIGSQMKSLAQQQMLLSNVYCRMSHRNMLLIADVGAIGVDYQPGHAHADTLSFELSIGQTRLIVNSGTSTYDESEQRLWQRSSQAHNTLVVNDQNSSHIWKSFRVARRARVRDVTLQHQLLKATHDGYDHRYHLLHTRAWQFVDDTLHIHDQIDFRKRKHHSYKIALHFHFHPDVLLIPKDDTHFQCLLKHNNQCIAEIECASRAQLHVSTYHPEFNLALPNQKLIVTIHTERSMSLTTTVRCNNSLSS